MFAKTLSERARVAIIVAVGALMAWQPCARAAESPPVPQPDELMNVVRDTVLAVDTGNKSGHYEALRALGTTVFQADHPVDKLATEFASLRALNLDLSPVREMVPLTTRPPALDRNGLLRILGFFQVAGRQLVYDLVYDYQPVDHRWALQAILLDPRPIAPKPVLMQPQ